MRIFLILLVESAGLVFSVHTHAQDFCMGARTRSLGNTGVADTTVWSLWNNPAGISRLSGYHAIISDERLYGLSEIRSFSAGIIVPVKKKYITGISLHKQGYEYFNDQQIGIHVAHAIDMYSIGASFVIWQRIAGESFNEIYPIVNIGGTMSLNHAVQVGLHLSNITNTQNAAENIPVQVKVGVLYILSKQVLFYSDLISKSNEHLHLNTGLEYRIHKHFFVRAGVMSKPMRMNAGLGFNTRKCSVDYSFSWQQPLGFIHQLSVSFTLKKQL